MAPANNVIAPIPGDRASCLAYLANGESNLPESFDYERGIEKLGAGYYKRLARTLTHLKAMVAAYRLNAPAVLILDEQEQPVKHPDFQWDSTLDGFVDGLKPGWTHVQLSVLALSDSFGVLVKDWSAAGRPATLPISKTDRARPNTELWSYGAYLVSKAGLANTLLTYSNREASTAGGSAKTLKFDLSRATCIEADNCLLWEGVHGEGWYVATPPLLAAGAQVTYDEADAQDVEVAVSELIKENMYHVKRWWEKPDDLLADAKAGSLSLPSDAGLDDIMEAVGIKPVNVPTPVLSSVSSPTTTTTISSSPFSSSSSDDDLFASTETDAVVADDDVAKTSTKKSSKKSKKTKGSSGDSFYDDSGAAVVDEDGVGDTEVVASESAAADAVETTTAMERTAATPTIEPTPVNSHTVSPSEAAAAEAAGITHTQSAFDLGKDLWNKAWGSDGAPAAATDSSVAAGGSYVAATGSTVSSRRGGATSSAPAAAAPVEEEVPDQDEVANMLDQYQSEPHLGGDGHKKRQQQQYINKRAKASAALGAWRQRGGGGGVGGGDDGRQLWGGYARAALGSALPSSGATVAAAPSESSAVVVGALAAVAAAAVVVASVVAAFKRRQSSAAERENLITHDVV